MPTTRDMSDLATLWARVRPQVRAFIRAGILDRHDCEDVLQETVRYIVEHFDEYDPERPFVAWAIGIARYRVFEHRQKQARGGRLLADGALDQVAEMMSDPTSEEGHEDDRREALQACLGQLPSKHWVAIYQRYYENASVNRMAEFMDSTPNAVSALLRRIRIVLSDCVGRRLAAGHAGETR